ncbi:endonuclease V [Methanocella sp. CWC-04]|uniref:Endonuclease V n=1 Tax=Methanooceanicella nereidis TaxID=2052831 RepID=A0AAP2RCW6_9EURY|nr:endonuclease V [Methanocella sp. CWC-04]
MNVKELYEEQKELAKQAILVDSFDKMELIGGVDCAYFEDNVISGAVVIDYNTFELVDKAYDVLKVDFPYIPGLLAYREAVPMMAAVKKLKIRPDILMVDGFGTNHPRRCGIATYIGIKLDIPAMGVGKSYMYGKVEEDEIYQDGEKVCQLLYSRKSKRPVYISPGHRISLSTSVDIARHFMDGGRIPLPVKLADEYVADIKQKILKTVHT